MGHIFRKVTCMMGEYYKTYLTYNRKKDHATKSVSTGRGYTELDTYYMEYRNNIYSSVATYEHTLSLLFLGEMF